MKNKFLTLAILSSISTGLFAQDPRNSDIKITAKIDAGCYLTAENINFGVLQMPLSDSISQSNMKIHCSKNANLDISLLYGESTSTGGTYTVQIHKPGDNTWHIFENGTQVGSIACSKAESGANVYYHTDAVRDLVGSSNPISQWVPDTDNLCTLSEYSELKIDRITSLGSSGILSGLVSGEKIQYFIEKPSSNSQIWSKNNSYKIIASGDEQNIIMKANIKRLDNPTYRMTPDTYQSTLTVVLSY